MKIIFNIPLLLSSSLLLAMDGQSMIAETRYMLMQRFKTVIAEGILRDFEEHQKLLEELDTQQIDGLLRATYEHIRAYEVACKLYHNVPVWEHLLIMRQEASEFALQQQKCSHGRSWCIYCINKKRELNETEKLTAQQDKDRSDALELVRSTYNKKFWKEVISLKSRMDKSSNEEVAYVSINIRKYRLTNIAKTLECRAQELHMYDSD